MDNITSYKVTVLPMGTEFDIRSDESVVQAAVRQSVRLPYRCTVGHCGACLSKLVSGETHYPTLEPMLTEREKAADLVFLCQLHAKSDLVVELIV